MKTTVVVFDFDETLVLENSLGYLFQEIAGKNYWTAAIPAITLSVFCLKFGYKLRLSVKQALYKKHLKGVSENAIYQAGTIAASRLTVNNKVMDMLKSANERGDTVVVATASPRIYVTGILDELKVNRFKVLGTEVDLEAGCILGKECSREVKWLSITKELNSLEVDNITGYGNAPDDIFMLKQVDQGFLVKGLSVYQYGT
jgi:HAD superfamily phosphoserine phosphatase-like hydrolase